MNFQLNQSALFSNMSDEEIQNCLTCSRSEIISYEKDQIIFSQHDKPNKLHVLLDGSVVICNDSVSGKRNIVATIGGAGDLFGEVFLFLSKGEYDHYAQAAADTSVLLIPKEFLYHTCGENCDYHTKLISNLMGILAQKAYYLNQKLQIMSAGTLRQKIARVLFMNSSEDGNVELSMNREELADFLNAARPSLSRELMRMQEEGLLLIKKKKIIITDKNQFQDIL
ncbi:CRP-like cAMP-binding protein [Kineothrix alysoides]|uniref:CRP-like cAMP-binding protein n=1 Tax=Kineothrix alysoides TaxID=1469948 RepID=A0A4R1QSQ9_9FIRM|nr:Crp/Fnr family transcriptional regulator [Kineothrix alysoides]TCL56878.1 CRP-like cAMP-binding protein [Kineothrix alysoides]